MLGTSHSKLIGGIFLIIGTSVGGGMLGIPVANASIGALQSTLLLVACWLLMTLSALLILEANMWMPRSSNLITMADKTLGRVGRWAAWFCFLFLFYALLCAYVAGGSDIFRSVIALSQINIPHWLAIVLFILLFGGIVHQGISPVVKATNTLIVVKTILFISLIAILSPQIDFSHFPVSQTLYVASATMVVITSFGFAVIVPSLRSHFNDDVKQLRLAIIIGSLVILATYMAWNFAVIGVIPRIGDNSLATLHASSSQNSDMVTILYLLTGSSWISYGFQSFASVVLLTSFLGVALSMTDFLADGLNVEKTGKQRWLISGLTFIPPVAIVLFNPGIFISALTYAGVIVVILLIILPALMAWSGRYCTKITKPGYEVAGGKITLIAILLASIAVFTFAVMVS